MEKIIFVPDMHCPKCVARIQKSLEEIDVDAIINLEDKCVKLNGSDECIELAFNTIYDIGFSPEKR